MKIAMLTSIILFTFVNNFFCLAIEEMSFGNCFYSGFEYPKSLILYITEVFLGVILLLFLLLKGLENRTVHFLYLAFFLLVFLRSTERSIIFSSFDIWKMPHQLFLLVSIWFVVWLIFRNKR